MNKKSVWDGNLNTLNLGNPCKSTFFSNTNYTGVYKHLFEFWLLFLD